MAKWVLCSERLPPDSRAVPIMTNLGDLLGGWWSKDAREWVLYGDTDNQQAVAWLDGVPEFKG